MDRCRTARECQSEWPSFRHDQQQSGNYDRDGTPPYAPTKLRLKKSKTAITFRAPGDDYGCGKATSTRWRHRASRSTRRPSATGKRLAAGPKPKASGKSQDYELGKSAKRYVAIRAVDEVGNVGWTASIDTKKKGGGKGGGPLKNGRCANRQRGTDRSDVLSGTKKGDRLIGGKGKDKLSGRGGDDCLNGGGDKDRLSGGSGKDKLNGGRKSDRLSGGSGKDRLKGAGGHDKLVGGPGKDKLMGGLNGDKIKARGGGRDIVDCGQSKRDIAIVDKRDKVKHCERIRRR